VYRNNAQLVARRDCVRHGRAAFNGTRIALGFAGNSTFRSPPGSYVAEWWFFSTALSAADRESCCRRKGLLRPAIVAIAS
jgi:hypothetical protein